MFANAIEQILRKGHCPCEIKMHYDGLRTTSNEDGTGQEMSYRTAGKKGFSKEYEDIDH